MTQEQYNRAVEIGKRLEKLEKVQKELGKGTSKLSFSTKIGGEYYIFSECLLSSISDILDRHDKMIREEIDAEIEKLKKEIEKL